ncbi:MAG: ABC transporter permease [Egibacteraceae bacterium]
MDVLIGRLVRLALLLAGVTVASFLLLELSPVDPVSAYIGAEVTRIGPEQRELIAERWGLDDPPLVRFGLLVGNLAQGDLGTSMIYNAPVAQVIGQRFLASLLLLALAWVMSGLIGFGLGLLAAVTCGSRLDRAIRWYAFTLASASTFWVGLLLLTIFSVTLGWTPVCCATPIGLDPAAATLGQRLHHLLLPAATLSIVGVGPITLHTRQQAVEILSSDYVTFARAQGEQVRGLIRHRLLRNAAVPALLLQFASLSELFGGSVLAETVFAYPGLGQATVQAALRGDVPLLVGITLFATVFVFVGNLIGDLVHTAVDPRVQLRPQREATT